MCFFLRHLGVYCSFPRLSSNTVYKYFERAFCGTGNILSIRWNRPQSYITLSNCSWSRGFHYRTTIHSTSEMCPKDGAMEF